jgi:hypothetical protein
VPLTADGAFEFPPHAETLATTQTISARRIGPPL